MVFFSNSITIITTVLILLLIAFIVLAFKFKEKVNHWGIMILILFIFGLNVCVQAATRDRYDMSVQHLIDGSNAGLFQVISFPSIMGIIGSIFIIVSGISCIFMRKQASKRKAFFIMAAAIIFKIVMVEISRIVLIIGG